MIKDNLISNYRYSVFQHVYKYMDVTRTCKLFNFSKTTFYE